MKSGEFNVANKSTSRLPSQHSNRQAGNHHYELPGYAGVRAVDNFALSKWNPGISISGLTLNVMKKHFCECLRSSPSAAWPQRYEGNAVPGHAFGKVARIT